VNEGKWLVIAVYQRVENGMHALGLPARRDVIYGQERSILVTADGIGFMGLVCVLISTSITPVHWCKAYFSGSCRRSGDCGAVVAAHLCWLWWLAGWLDGRCPL